MKLNDYQIAVLKMAFIEFMLEPTKLSGIKGEQLEANKEALKTMADSYIERAVKLLAQFESKIDKKTTGRVTLRKDIVE